MSAPLKGLKQETQNIRPLILWEESDEEYDEKKGELSPRERGSRPLILSRALEAELTSKEKVFSNYSGDELEGISQQLWFPIESNLQDSDSGSSNGSMENIESNSWFSRRALEVRDSSFVKTCSPSSIPFPVESAELANLGKKSKNPKKKEARMLHVYSCQTHRQSPIR
jgi:hypothetical protein